MSCEVIGRFAETAATRRVRTCALGEGAVGDVLAPLRAGDPGPGHPVYEIVAFRVDMGLEKAVLMVVAAVGNSTRPERSRSASEIPCRSSPLAETPLVKHQD